MLIISPKTKRRHETTRRGLLTGAAALSMFEGLQLSDAQAQSPCGTFWPVAPKQASDAGIATLWMADDFAIPGTLAPDTKALSGYNLYPASSGGIGANTTTATVTTGGAAAANGTPTANSTVYTQATAAGLKNKNTSGGSFASPNGGILTMIAPPFTNGGIATLTTTATPTQYSSLPATGTIPIIKSFYCHVYAQLNPLYNCNGQWSGIWFEPQLRIIPPNQSFQGNLEIDQMELAGNNNGYTASNRRMSSSTHEWIFTDAQGSSRQWSGGGGDYVNAQFGSALQLDEQWHLFGFLCKNNGNGTGYVTVYLDNSAIFLYSYANPIKTGITGGAQGFEWVALDWKEYLIFSACYAQSGANQGSNFANSGNSTTLQTPCFNVDYYQIFVGSV